MIAAAAVIASLAVVGSVIAAPVMIASSAPSPTVTLKQGTFVGQRIVVEGQTVDVFRGIPFAAPPVGDLRWRAPQPPIPADGIRNATNFAPQCPQIYSSTGIGNIGQKPPPISEDCLYIDVYVPADVVSSGSSPLPVMQWVYGGSFTNGGTNSPFYNGPLMVANAARLGNPVIVALANYRLNAFGFLASADLKDARALNLGLLDQRAAFLWTRKNIAAFGGDAENLVAFGESAGAISIGAHLVATQPHDHDEGADDARSGLHHGHLFDRAILESGAAITGTLESAQKKYDYLLSATDCAGAANRLDCLRNVPYDVILNTTSSFGFGIVVDGEYIQQQPILAQDKGDFIKIPLLLGTNTDEGLIFVEGISTESDLSDYIISYDLDPSSQAAVASFYNSSLFFNSPNLAAAALFSDSVFLCPIRSLATAYSTNSRERVYKYRFNVPPPGLNIPFVPHAAEIPFVWADDFFFVGDKAAKAVSDSMLRRWTQFARADGRPNVDDGLADWPRYRADPASDGAEIGGLRLRFDLSGPIVEVEDSPQADRCALWNELARKQPV